MPRCGVSCEQPGGVVLTAAVSPFVRWVLSERRQRGAPSRPVGCGQVGCRGAPWEAGLFTSRPPQRNRRNSEPGGGQESCLAPVSCQTLASPCCCERRSEEITFPLGNVPSVATGRFSAPQREGFAPLRVTACPLDAALGRQRSLGERRSAFLAPPGWRFPGSALIYAQIAAARAELSRPADPGSDR